MSIFINAYVIARDLAAPLAFGRLDEAGGLPWANRPGGGEPAADGRREARWLTDPLGRHGERWYTVPGGRHEFATARRPGSTR